MNKIGFYTKTMFLPTTPNCVNRIRKLALFFSLNVDSSPDSLLVYANYHNDSLESGIGTQLFCTAGTI